MINVYAYALSEVYSILKSLPEHRISKIPKQILDYIENERDKNIVVEVKKPLKMMNYSKEARVFIGMIYKEYMCTKEEKDKIEALTQAFETKMD